MRRVLLLVILSTFIGDGRALAGTLVEFPNLPGREPLQLIGYLARPDTGLSVLIRTTSRDVGPYPGVIVLHGCAGISSHSAANADRLGAWGYVALTIDTLGPSGMDSGCYSGTFVEQAFDAYAALRYLSTLKVVDAERVALFGQCKTLRNLARPDSASINLIVYPGVHHGFDVAQLKPGRSSDGRWLEYAEPAAHDAEEKTRAFLAEHLVSMPATPQPSRR